jgi:hypothetical protein
MMEDSPSLDKKRKHFTQYSLSDVVFDTKFNDKKTIELLTCSICLNIMQAPVTILKCQHTFCSSCINGLFGQDIIISPCPQCREEFSQSQTTSNWMVTSFIDILKVPCIHKNCKWISNYSELEHHVKSDCECLKQCECTFIYDTEDYKEHIIRCPAIKVKCDYCGEMMKRSELKKHTMYKCEKNIITCSCSWKGTRIIYHNEHIKECKVSILEKENKELKENRFFEKYASSNCFITSGLSSEDTKRAALIQRYIYSYLKLNFDVTFGDINTDTISICGIKNDSIFKVDFGKLDSSNIQLDINQEKGVLAMTLSLHNRFFIFRHKTIKPTVEKAHFGRIQITIPQCGESELPCVMVFAHRRFMYWKNGSGEVPFCIEPSSRYFTQFLLKCKDQSDHVMTALEKFFNV